MIKRQSAYDTLINFNNIYFANVTVSMLTMSGCQVIKAALIWTYQINLLYSKIIEASSVEQMSAIAMEGFSVDGIAI